MEKKATSDNRVFIRTIIISTILLGALLFVLDWVFHNLLGDLSGFGKGVKVGLSLLVFWLIVTSSIRSLNRLAKDISGPKLLLAGMAIALLGTFFNQFILQVLTWFNEPWVPRPNYNTSLFYGVGGLIASIISLINLRVKDQKLGNVLEFLFIAGVAILFFYLAK